MSGTTRDRLTPVDGTDERPVYYDQRRGTYHTYWDTSDYEPVSTALLMAVSSVRDVDPAALESLSSRVDPDAMNALAGHWEEGGGDGRPSGSLTFPFARCTVTVRADGEIVIDPDGRVEPPAGS